MPNLAYLFRKSYRFIWRYERWRFTLSSNRSFNRRGFGKFFLNFIFKFTFLFLFEIFIDLGFRELILWKCESDNEKIYSILRIFSHFTSRFWLFELILIFNFWGAASLLYPSFSTFNFRSKLLYCIPTLEVNIFEGVIHFCICHLLEVSYSNIWLS